MNRAAWPVREAVFVTVVSTVLGLVSPACMGESTAEAAAVDDKDIHEKFQSELVKLMGSGQTLTGDELAKQDTPDHYPVTPPPATRRRLSATDIYRDLRRSVLVLGSLYKCDKCDKWHLNTASGFVLTDKGIAVTNYHVVKKASHAAFGAMTADGRVLPVVELLAADEQNDVALIRIRGESFHPLPLLVDDPPGTPVVVISHPTRRFYTMTAGIISRYFYKHVNDERYPRMEITADFAKGSSGAPVLDLKGNVVGIVASTKSIYYSKREGHMENLQMVVNNCIPARAIRTLTEKPQR